MESLPDAVIGHLREVVNRPDFVGTRYEVIAEIGRGGMGTVYAALDGKLGRRVALKVLNILDSGGQAAARMAEEARILARLEHPGIVPVHDFGELPDGRVYYAMKLVDGARLDCYAQAGPPVGERLRVFLRICETVAFAHSQGVIHRDLKPQNIMVGPFGEVLVLDWGVAKITGMAREFLPANAAGRDDTAPGTAVGTPGYTAPEQASGTSDQVDARSDVYSLGRTLAALLEGGEIPRRLRAISQKAASPERTLRYTTVAELAADVERFQSGERVLAYRETPAERLGRLVTRNQMVVLLVATYLVMRVLLFFLPWR
ncbi:MAG TPA: serine/threonine-protein kinase [Bryobacteraceae bacterium]|nr:serine/threonine-protein kinase [Bryobacteraceae bacterium]